jgi:hypothetical protein
MKFALQFGLVMLIALVLTVVPGGGPAVNGLFTVLLIVFLAAIALFGYRLYRQNRFTLDSLEPQVRLVLYSSLALALLAFTATGRLIGAGPLGVVAWLALLGLCSYGVFWAYTRSRAYE